ncbi:ABC transporter permease [Rhizobium sp. CG5]|nr:ABC transporter permease [Rhizobium sp. CG5]
MSLQPARVGTARDWQLIIGCAILFILAGAAIAAPILAPFGPWELAGRAYLPPLSGPHLLGTDTLGRDVLSGVIYGARVSLIVGIASTAAAIMIGTIVGGLAGYFGGIVDDLLMRFTEFLQTMPGLALALVMVAVLGPSMWSVVLAISLVTWAPVARLIRAEFFSLRGREFIMAATVIGESHWKIITSHMLPNALAPIISVGSLKVASGILTESTISFLGLGDVNRISWGMMIGMAQSNLRDAWWMSVFPGLALFATVLALTLISDSLARLLGMRKQSML